MVHKHLFSLIILILGQFAFTPAFAEGEIPPLTMQKADIAAYTELSIFYNISGTRETLKQEGQVFVSITASFEPPWSESFKKLKVNWKEITLSDGNTDMPMIGFTQYYGVNKLGTQSWSKSRPSSWKKKSKPLPYNAIFLVPDKSKTLQLTIGPNSWEFQVPQPNDARPG